MTEQLRLIRPARGLSISVSHNCGRLGLNIGGTMHSIDPEVAVRLADELVDAYERAAAYQKAEEPQ